MTKYRIACWIPVNPEPEDEALFNTKQEAEEKLEQAEFLQPENIYRIEEVQDDTRNGTTGF